MKLFSWNILFTVFLLNSVVSLKSQDFWEQLYFPDSANIHSIAVDDQQLIYIGSGAGIYFSDNNGGSWEILGLENRTVYSIALNNNNDIYAGTNQSPQVGGLFRSSDYGETWSSILPDIGANGNILAMLCLGDTIFASLWMTDASVVRSTDNGQTWDIVFFIANSTSYISDIIISNSGTIYLGNKTYSEGMGGVYKSEDGGNSWEFTGLLNYQVTALAVNSVDDLFAGSWGGLSDSTTSGLYVLRNGEENWETLLANPQVSDIIINNEDDIYFSSSWPNGVVQSLDNGETFELVNEGLPLGPMGDLAIDNLGFLYVSSHYLSNFLAKSINSTVSISEENVVNTYTPYLIYPNPVNDFLHIDMLNTANALKLRTLCIYSALGNVLISEDILSPYNIIINVSELPAGWYLVELSGDNIKTIARILVN